MPLFADDVSEFVATSHSDLTTLVVEIDGFERGARAKVRARVNDGPTMTSPLAISPEWAAQPSSPHVQTASKYSVGESANSLGTRLFTALFSGGLSRSWAQAVELARSGGGLHLVIRSSDASVQALPWELLIDPLTSAGPLVLSDRWSVIRQPAASPATEEPAPTPVEPKDLDVLVMTSEFSGVSQENDPDIIRRAFEGAEVQAFRGITKRALRRRLGERSRDVVHILAVGGGRTRQGHHVLLVGRNTDPEAVTAEEFVEALGEGAARPRLVVLAACDSDLVAAELAEFLPNVIGIRGRISDEGCLAFLRGMYRALGSGSTLDQAVAAGRAQQVGFSQSLGEEWALPVLFQRDGSPLVRQHHTIEVPRPPIPIKATLGTPEDGADQILLEMKTANLSALRDQWSQVEKQNVPSFVRKQIEDLEDEVARRSQK